MQILGERFLVFAERFSLHENLARKPNVRNGRPHVHLIFPLLGHGIPLFVEDNEIVGCEFHAHFRAFPRLQIDFGKAFQFLSGTDRLRILLADVYLNDLRARRLARIFYEETHFLLVLPQIRVFELCITQTEAERIASRNSRSVVMSIAEKRPHLIFAQAFAQPQLREFFVRVVVAGSRQFSRGIAPARQKIYQRLRAVLFQRGRNQNRGAALIEAHIRLTVARRHGDRLFAHLSEGVH